MTTRGTTVTAHDNDSGEELARSITDDYVLICDGKCRVTGIQRHANGTHVITIKGAP